MNKIFTVIVLLFTSFVLNAQNNPVRPYTPYSQGNLGYLNSDFYTKNFGMGNVGIANYDKYSPNLKNASLLTHNKFTVLDVNLGVRNDNLEFGSSKQSTTTGGLNSINILMPLSYKWTTAFSLTPYSSTTYGGETRTVIAGTSDTLIQSDTSYGGIQRLTWSNGFNVYKNLNVGLTASYSFGNIVKVIGTEVLNINSQTINQVETSKYKGFDFGVSTSYEKEFVWSKAKQAETELKDTLIIIKENGKKRIVAIKDFRNDETLFSLVSDTVLKAEKSKEDKKIKIGFGATYSSPFNWNKDNYSIVNNSISQTIDTTNSAVNTASNLGLGLSIGNVSRVNNWLLAVDYELSSAYQFEIGNTINDIPAASKISVGLQFTPEIESENFFKNTTYSVGGYQAKTSYVYAGEQLEEVGTHFGLSFVDRAKRSNESFRWREKSKRRLNYLSRYNIGVGFGMLGGNSTTSIQQTFVKFNIGISLNSEWFVRRKIN